MRHLKRGLSATVIAATLVVGSAVPVAAAAGDFDTTFNGTGSVLLQFGPGNYAFTDVAIQPGDQKIVAVGSAHEGFANGRGRWLVARLNPDGTLDASFGGGDGFVTLGWSRDDDYATAVALQADGKIVAVGRSGGPVKKWAIARFTTSGALDTTFAGDGKTGLDLTSNSEHVSGIDIATDVAIQQDQRIVVTGWTDAFDARFIVARFRANGKLDATFGGDGIATANLTPLHDDAHSVSIDSFGRIVLAGTAGAPRHTSGPVPGEWVGLARFRSNGTLDANFSGDGKVLTNVSTGWDTAYAMAIQSADNKIVVVGDVDNKTFDSRIAALRYNANGTPDLSFSGDGRLTINIARGDPYESAESGRGVAVQDDGKIVLAGWAQAGTGGTDQVLARLTPTGRLDGSFGSGGISLVDFSTTGEASAAAGAVAIQADSAIVTVGDMQPPMPDLFRRATVARFLGG
jgi:uncharacterized delta-60 repeat protein